MSLSSVHATAQPIEQGPLNCPYYKNYFFCARCPWVVRCAIIICKCNNDLEVLQWPLYWQHVSGAMFAVDPGQCCCCCWCGVVIVVATGHDQLSIVIRAPARGGRAGAPWHHVIVILYCWCSGCEIRCTMHIEPQQHLMQWSIMMRWIFSIQHGSVFRNVIINCPCGD